ncbi:MAG: type 1 glutamine amidotransferase [Phycisphaerales bacterium]|nr:type 1 glutamine amidotransferase [Phycisphaerales bacterium]
MAIILFQHAAHCRPGRLGTTLRDHGFTLDIRRLDDGDPVPPDFDNVEGVISMGGPQNVGEAHAWIKRETEFLREAHERQLPVVGVCLGAQLLAHALGGEVGPMEGAGEIGFTDVNILPPAQTDTVLSGIAWRSPQFQKHKQEVKKLPAGAALLASSDRCKVQAFRAGMRSYGFQYHFECDMDMIRTFTKDSVGELHGAGLTTDEFEKQCQTKYEMFARLADRLCLNIATYLIPRVATLSHA